MMKWLRNRLISLTFPAVRNLCAKQTHELAGWNFLKHLEKHKTREFDFFLKKSLKSPAKPPTLSLWD